MTLSNKPTVGGDAGTWGQELNDALDELDASITSTQAAVNTNTSAISSLNTTVSGLSTTVAGKADASSLSQVATSGSYNDLTDVPAATQGPVLVHLGDPDPSPLIEGSVLYYYI